MRTLALSACLAAAAAQMRAKDVTVRWFAEPSCSAEPHTTVVLNQGFCNVVPNAAAFAGYKASCGADGVGILSYCADTACTNCTEDNTLLFSSGACLANSRELYGNAGVTVVCPTPGAVGEEIVAEIEDLSPAAAEINYFEFPGCGKAPLNVDRSIVVVQQSLCQRVPNAPGHEGYRVDCSTSADGRPIATLSFCTDAACADCPIVTPVGVEECAASPPETGSASLAVRCPGTPPTPIPFF
jgi:hypothetical protein